MAPDSPVAEPAAVERTPNPFLTRPLPAPRPFEPFLEIDQPQQSFGSLYEGDRSEHRFWFRNDGQKPLVILTVKHSCGCTDDALFLLEGDRATRIGTGTPIPPGAVGYLDVTFNSEGQLDKRRVRSTLTVNNTRQEKLTLELTGSVQAAFQVTPSPLEFDRVFAGRGAEAKVRVRCTRGRPFQILGFEGDVQGIAYEARTPAPDRPQEQELTLRIEPGATLGPAMGQILFRTQIEGEPAPRRLAVMIRADVVGALQVEPESLSFGSVPVGAGAATTIRLASHAEALEVTGVEVQSSKREFLAATVQDGATSEEAVIEVTVAADCPAGVLSGAILISTTLASKPTIRVAFSGFVED